MRCWVCGQAPIKRWQGGVGVCGKLAHRLNARRSRKELARAQRSKRSMLDGADEDERRGIFRAFGLSLRSIFKRAAA